MKIAGAYKEITKFAEDTGIPVVTTIMGKGAISTNNPLYIGNLGIHGSYAANTSISECDVLFAIGVRFNDRITGNVNEFAKNTKIIHVDIDPTVISKNILAEVEIVGDAKKIINLFIDRVPKIDCYRWREEIYSWKEKYPLGLLQKNSSMLTPYAIINEINKNFDNAIITTDVGQNQLWTTQFLELDSNKQMLTSGGLGTMGYGLPAAIGSKIGNMNKDVITICGDGGFQMNLQELATAMVYELPIIICIFNNGYLGNVRQWQEMFFDKRYSNTCLRYRKSCPKICNSPTEKCPSIIPDFIKLAESYGAKAIRVTKLEDIKKALLEGKNEKNVPTVIKFMIEREENVLPIVPPGNSLENMIMEQSNNL